MNTWSKWTIDEEQLLKEMYSNSSISFTEFEKIFSRNWRTIQKKARLLGLKRELPKTTKKYKLLLSKSEIIDLYNSGKSTVEIANICGCSNVNISGILKRNGVKTRSQSELQRKYDINETYFDNIDTEEKAYFLGLLYADGCNYQINNTVCLKLAENDKGILDKLNNLIQPSKPLRFTYLREENHSNQYSLVIENKHMSNALADLGVVQAKTFKITFPEWLNPNLIHHFVRGYFDGDGCIVARKDPIFSLVGTEMFLLKIQEIMINECGINKTKLHKRNNGRDNNTRTLIYGGKNNALKIKEWLYKDATVYFVRKYNKYPV